MGHGGQVGRAIRQITIAYHRTAIFDTFHKISLDYCINVCFNTIIERQTHQPGAGHCVQPHYPGKGHVMLKRTFWTVILVVAILVDIWWLDRALGDYAAPIELIVISVLAIIILFAATQVVGLTLISQKWVDEVEIIEEEEEQELDDLQAQINNLRELVDWKANQMASIETYAIERLDDLQAQINKLGDLKNYDFAGHAQTIKELQAQINLHDSRIKELQDDAGLAELSEQEK